MQLCWEVLFASYQASTKSASEERLVTVFFFSFFS